MFGSLGPTELIIALVIILLLFGAKKVPELARGLGSGVREFRAGTKEGEMKDKKAKDEELAAAESTSDGKADEAHDPHLEQDKDIHAGPDASVDTDRAEQKQR